MRVGLYRFYNMVTGMPTLTAITRLHTRESFDSCVHPGV